MSEILLGGNGSGADILSSLLLKNPRQTIGGYFDQRINQPHTKTGTEINYLLNAYSFNNKVPTNLHLVGGDPSLELQAQAINQIAAQSLPADAWKNVHSWVIDVIAHPSRNVSPPNHRFAERR